ncbi:hypothetical protein ACPCVO_35690 [Streptomyces umbrinus]|uniref:hypothetical protein n=1 Tax=Streptomyces umbrinus TaxID=67370 RepID=UPI003C2FE04D
MTQPLLRRHLLTAAAGMLVCALATVAALHITPAWAKTLCLIAAATALSTAAKALWPPPALPSAEASPRVQGSSTCAERSVLPPQARRRGI